jgi:hypothetical protein
MSTQNQGVQKIIALPEHNFSSEKIETLCNYHHILCSSYDKRYATIDAETQGGVTKA